LSSPAPTRAPSSLNRLTAAAARFLFPSTCLACHTDSVEEMFRGGVCARCWARLPELAAQRCQVCDVQLPAFEAVRCGRCILDSPPFDSLRGVAPYRGSARRILLAFKFRGADYLAVRLAKLMAEKLPLPESVQEVTAVPANRSSRWKHDHAAELLGRAVARELGIPFSRQRLEKVRATEQQSRLPYSDRAGNVRGAFRGRGTCPENILLVDDVVTSGATARECANALRKIGAKHVSVWCFTRASRGDALADWQPEPA